GALLAFLGLVAALLEAPGRDDPAPLAERAGDVLGELPPHRGPQEQRLAVLPVVGGAVEGARRGGDREVRDREPVLRVPEFRVGGEFADDGDDGLPGHDYSASLSSAGSAFAAAGADAFGAAALRAAFSAASFSAAATWAIAS